MLKDGQYAAWFRTSRGEGTGIVHLANGKISGGDSIFTYGGSYEIDEDRFTATLTTRRHSAGPPTVFGVDEVEVTLTGTFNGRMASCSGKPNRRRAWSSKLRFSLAKTSRLSPIRSAQRCISTQTNCRRVPIGDGVHGIPFRVDYPDQLRPQRHRPNCLERRRMYLVAVLN